MEIVERLTASAQGMIVADRRNAEKSTGLPAGKRCAAQNALNQSWYSAAKAWAPSVRRETPADSGPARGLERGARSRAECGRSVDKTSSGEEGPVENFFGTKPTDPFRINMTFRKSPENKAIAILKMLPARPASLSSDDRTEGDSALSSCRRKPSPFALPSSGGLPLSLFCSVLKLRLSCRKVDESQRRLLTWSGCGSRATAETD